MKLVWDASAWEDYVWWQSQDRKVLKRINTLIKDVQRNGNEGIGKPEPLKHGFHGYGSRRPPTSTASSTRWLRARSGSPRAVPPRSLKKCWPRAFARGLSVLLNGCQPALTA